VDCLESLVLHLAYPDVTPGLIVPLFATFQVCHILRCGETNKFAAPEFTPVRAALQATSSKYLAAIRCGENCGNRAIAPIFTVSFMSFNRCRKFLCPLEKITVHGTVNLVCFNVAFLCCKEKGTLTGKGDT
jgi:hypothetical protein